MILDPEIFFAMDLIEREVSFFAVRKYIFTLNALFDCDIGCFIEPKKINRIYCDASDNGIGICAYLDQKYYGFSIKLQRNSEIFQFSINVKELYSLVISLIFAKYLDWEIGQTESDWIVFIDNEVAKTLSITQKPNLRAQNLINLTLLISRLQMYFQWENSSSFFFQRICSENNVLADLLSRDFTVTENMDTALLGDIFSLGAFTAFITD